MSTGKIVLGTLAGLAVGAIAGILCAPEKGSKIRRKIMHKGEDYMDDMKSKFDDILDSLTNQFENSKKEVKNSVSENKQSV
jgi:gas vesicle protein